MLIKMNTKEEATREWVKEFNAFPESMIEIIANHTGDFIEVTCPCVGDRVYYYDTGDYGEVVAIQHHISGCPEEEIPDEYKDDYKDWYDIKLDNGDILYRQTIDDFEEVNRHECFPMWGTMWQFNNSCDDYWLEELNGLQAMSKCGFRIYYSEEFGYFFGIDGCGYDFYEAHWIPLYEARGLKWHEGGEEQYEK